MRFFDTSTKKRYDVQDFVFKGSGITRHKMIIETSTEKAFLFLFEDGLRAWVPKSCCKEIKIVESLKGFLQSD